MNAWLELSPAGSKPTRIEILKEKVGGSVYRLVGVGPDGTAIVAKRSPTAKAIHERYVYDEILPRLPVAALRFHGFVHDEDAGFSWLFLEDAGSQRYSPSMTAHRVLAARWFGVMHSTAGVLYPDADLPDRGPDLYSAFVTSVVDQIPRLEALTLLPAADRSVLMKIVSICSFLESRWSQVDSFCRRVPRTFVHDDCSAKNVHVRVTQIGPALAPFDWGGSGWGLPATDLGQLRLPYDGQPPRHIDFRTYHAVIRERWPDLSVPTIQRLANFGQMFWSLKVISRSLPSFLHQRAHLDHVMQNYRVYAAILGDSVRSARLPS